MGYSNFKGICLSEMVYDASQETCPSEMTYDASRETCPSEMTYDASEITCKSEMTCDVCEKCIGPCEIEEMDQSDLKETCPSEMTYDASRETCPSGMTFDASEITCKSEMTYDVSEKCIGPCEIKEKDKSNLRGYFVRRIINKMEWRKRMIYLEKGLRKRLIYLGKELLSVRIFFRHRLIDMLLLVILLAKINKWKFLASPDRLKISCITVYLIGNDGAHFYNGNGILLTKRRKYSRFSDEELLDEIWPANLPLDVLLRQPTDKEIARLSGKIGQEYRVLAYELGLTRVQLDHLTLDCPTTLLRIERMFFIWRDEIEDNATFETLVKAMDMHGINPDIVYQSLERA